LHDYLLAVLLGVIEGLTEFLPVSSTAHLRISESLLGIDLANGYWKMFSIVIQLGAILCLPLYFWRRITEFVRDFPRGKRGDRTPLTHPLSLTLIAFVVTAGPSYLLTKVIGKNLENLYVIATALIVGGVIMWLVDAIYERSNHQAFAHPKLTTDMEEMSLGQAVWVGLCQILSGLFPGTSRSMATITGGELAGMDRPTALEFSFFVSLPVMLTASLYTLFKSLHHHDATSEIGNLPTDAHHVVTLVIGFVVSFIVAYAVVAWFMNWVRTRGFTVFAVYRLLLGAFVLWYAGHAIAG